MCKENRYDLIFMDDQMPGLNGHQTTKKITKHQQIMGEERTIVIIVGDVTNDKQMISTSKQEAHKNGAYNYLVRPLKSSMLTEALDNIIMIVNNWNIIYIHL